MLLIYFGDGLVCVLACFHPFFSMTKHLPLDSFSTKLCLNEIERWNERPSNSQSSAYRNKEDEKCMETLCQKFIENFEEKLSGEKNALGKLSFLNNV
jgi:hypothetical protein